ncbi:hypothetical protein GJ496_011673 [Pomphorhynchus laevis]|nr:hypothetical protein GJ496_011673 [Pomphorhynchus laevis]
MNTIVRQKTQSTVFLASQTSLKQQMNSKIAMKSQALFCQNRRLRSRKTSIVRKALRQRIDLWRAGKIQYLLDEARYLQHTKDGKANYQVEENWHKTFTRLMLRGNIGGAVRTLDGKALFGKCLKLNEKVGQLTVKQALSEKHPHGVNLHEEVKIDSVTNTGVEVLGCPIGSAEYEKSWLDDKIENWMMIQRLAEIAKIDPQLAYSAYMVSLQHK